MNDILDIEIILKKQKYNCIYNSGIILLIILCIFTYISFVYKYETYYITNGIMTDSNLKILVDINDIKYINNHNELKIDNNNYQYRIIKISDEMYVDENFKNYKYIYLKVKNLNNINNYVYQVKIKKENKKIIEYLKEYL